MFKNAFILIISVLCFLSVWQINSKSTLSSFGEPYETYTQNNSSMAKIIPTEKLKYTFLKTGESIIIENQDLEQIFKNLEAETVFTETTSDGVSLYAYSKNIKNQIIINNKKVNLQIFVSKTKTVIGTPIIFGSF